MAGKHRAGGGRHREPDPPRSRLQELGQMDRLALLAILHPLVTDNLYQRAQSMTRDQIIAEILRLEDS